MDITKTLIDPIYQHEDHFNAYYVQSLLDDSIRTVGVKFSEDGYEYAYYVQSLLDDSIRTVGVKFSEDGYEYTYLTRLKLKVGDLVLTQDSRSKYKIVEISSLHEVPQIERFSEIEYKWILQKIDQKKHNKFLKREDKAITNIKNDLLIHQREKDLETL